MARFRTWLIQWLLHRLCREAREGELDPVLGSKIASLQTRLEAVRETLHRWDVRHGKLKERMKITSGTRSGRKSCVR